MSNGNDNWRLQSDLERMRSDRMKTEVYEPKTSKQEGYGFVVAALVLVFACGAAFYQGLLGYEAGLSLVVLLAAFLRKSKMKRLRTERRESQVREHGMKKGNPKFWGRNEE